MLAQRSSHDHSNGNVQLSGHAQQRRTPRTSPSVGATTHLHSAQYTLLTDVQAGQELVLFGDEDANTNVAEQVVSMDGEDDASAPRYLLEQLQQDGMCLDQIVSGDSTVTDGRGAFARRNLTTNQVIAPVPVVAVLRQHLEMELLQAWPQGHDDAVWSGHQLLVNYAYSHPLSNLLLIPYGAGVTLINHAGGDSTKANVALQWSQQMSTDWLDMSVEQVLVEQLDESTGMMMELVALRDIEPGEELLLDYSDNWQRAWDRHVQLFRSPVNAETYVAPDVWNSKAELRTMQKGGLYYPAYIQAVCNIGSRLLIEATESMSDVDGAGYLEWEAADDASFVPCLIESADEQETTTYHVSVTGDGSEGRVDYKFIGVPRRAIAFVETPYTGNQHLRHAFRHPIEIPDNVWPTAWNDIALADQECGLYMAESTIPGAGMGVYTARDIEEEEPVPLFDTALLRPRMEDAPNQLIDCYSEEGAEGLFETNWDPHRLHSVVPGVGMLMNSIPGKNNVDYGPRIFLTAFGPQHTQTFRRRSLDSGIGASSDRHDVSFEASRNTQAGEELFTVSWT